MRSREQKEDPIKDRFRNANRTTKSVPKQERERERERWSQKDKERK